MDLKIGRLHLYIALKLIFSKVCIIYKYIHLYNEKIVNSILTKRLGGLKYQCIVALSLMKNKINDKMGKNYNRR
jgi:hypothetical protein